MKRRRLLTFIGLACLTCLMTVSCTPTASTQDSATDPASPPPAAVTLTVSAAASMQDAMNVIQLVHEEAHPEVTLVFNFGSSGSLQQQIEQGAPVDVFLSASPKQMNALEEKELLLEGTRRDLLKNSIVLVTSLNKDDVIGFDDLSAASVGKLSIGEPDSVPAGQYGKEALESMGLYETVQSKIVFAKDVRQVLTYVETGNVDAGLVYSTDAQVSEQVQVVATALEDSHSPIIYPAAVIADSANPEIAQAFVDFLATEEAIAIFQDFGFLPAT